MSNFLENYGKSIFVLVLIAILIAFASPLGIKIKEYTLARVDNLKQTSDDLIAGKPKVNPNEPKEVTDIYAILYTDGELDLSSKEIVPKEGKEVTAKWNKVTDYTAAWSSTTYREKIKTAKILDAIKPKTCEKMFYDCYKLKKITNFDKLYTSEVKNFSDMFYLCTIDINQLKNLNVSNGTNFSEMFKECYDLYDASILNSWKTNGTGIKKDAILTDMFKTYDGTIKNPFISNENEIDSVLYTDGELVLSHFKIKPTKEVLGTWAFTHNEWLYKYQSIESVRILDKIKPTDCSRMFYDCYKLKKITNFDKIDTSEVKNFSDMFYRCTIDINQLKNWDVSNGTDFSEMFKDCNNLYDASILNSWNVSVSATKTNMFYRTQVTNFPSWYK